MLKNNEISSKVSILKKISCIVFRGKNNRQKSLVHTLRHIRIHIRIHKQNKINFN